MRNFFKKTVVLLLAIFLMLIVVEIFLKFFQPFDFRLRNQKIHLSTNRAWTLLLPESDGLDAKSLVFKNSLGFRGTDPPDNFDQHLTMITVGGSTTESVAISEGNTWPDLLGKKLNTNFNRFWINNAGLNGHSTFAHLILLKDYLVPIRPKYLLFLIGINDLFLYEANSYDHFDFKKEGELSFDNLLNWSEIYILLKNLERKQVADRMNLSSTTVIDFNSIVVKESGEEPLDFVNLKKGDNIDNHDFLKEEQRIRKEKYLQDFQFRIEEIIRTARKHKIEPILITQPVVYGYGIDVTTGIDLSKIFVGLGYEDFFSDDQKSQLTGEKQWQFLEEYNDITRKVAADNSILLIDLAKKMEKNTKYYYDYIHFSKEGSLRVAEIIYEQLCPYLWERESSLFLKQSCN
jgi:lysophospholipase L1-like esterase